MKFRNAIAEPGLHDLASQEQTFGVINHARKLLEVQGLSKSFNGKQIFDPITFTANEGEIVVILGPSGCGKTTLLSIIAGLKQADSGSVLLRGQSIIGSSAHCSLMFQESRLLPWRTALENTILPAEVDGASDLTNARSRAVELLTLFGLEEHLHFLPSELSGGLARRVAFARTLLLNRSCYLFDEPFKEVDFLLQLQLEDILFSFLKSQNAASVIVTHDAETAVALADKILVFGGSPTKIVSQIESGLARKLGSPKAARQSVQFNARFQQILAIYAKK
jgi:NitT/TauT family transport system ATP-binding protein